ncbi:hypothetical protein AA0115_g12397 [Alternaria tenuissima]|uniref:Alcohol acetyltransferase n=1 Tax=Alternaria tenuissima TaxID=119927 RepID=A0AB37VZ95_9PLEO|nr:hypothetical protein AA0115_g12397 [Alternaria tenuissima]
MNKARELPVLRSLGKSEQLSAVSHELGFFKNVGISAHYSLSTVATLPDLQSVIYAALTQVIHRNSILSAVPIDELSPNAYFVRLQSLGLRSCVLFKTRASSIEQRNQDTELDTILQEEHNTDFKSRHGHLPFWRLNILQDTVEEKGCGFTASFVFHHSLGDGATGVIFHQSFHQALEIVLMLPSLKSSSPKIQVSESSTVLPPLEDLHPLPLNPNPLHHRTSGEELEEWTGNPIQLPMVSQYRTLFFSPITSAKFAQECKENGLTVTSGLTAVLASALFKQLPDTVHALTGIIPINLRPWLSLHDNCTSTNEAMGSFIDALKVQIRREHCSFPTDSDEHTGATCGLAAARHVSETIKGYMGNKSPTGEPYTSVAAFKGIHGIAAVFKSMVNAPRDAAFEISNLGRFSTPSSPSFDVPDGACEGRCRIGRMTFSRSAVGFGAAITTSVVMGIDGGLSVGWSWQEGVVDRKLVESVMDGFRRGVESGVHL